MIDKLTRKLPKCLARSETWMAYEEIGGVPCKVINLRKHKLTELTGLNSKDVLGIFYREETGWQAILRQATPEVGIKHSDLTPAAIAPYIAPVG